MLQEELEAVNALYCLPGECEFQDETLTISSSIESSKTSQGIPVQILFQIPSDYPASFPQISIFSNHLHRDIVNGIKTKCMKYCESLLNEPMLISLISTIQELIKEELDAGHVDNDDSVKHQANLKDERDSNIWTSVLHIDHMRSTNKYCKTLEKWASELTLNGAILFINKLILVILQGSIDSIKDFTIRLKTVSVDVDSKGHSCKERMMSVLCQQQNKLSEITRFTEFEKRHLENKEELKSLFKRAGLGELYNEHITQLYGRYP
ncbi:RWD domain-containing protein 3 [Mactra antiquata]